MFKLVATVRLHPPRYAMKYSFGRRNPTWHYNTLPKLKELLSESVADLVKKLSTVRYQE